MGDSRTPPFMADLAALVGVHPWDCVVPETSTAESQNAAWSHSWGIDQTVARRAVIVGRLASVFSVQR